MIFIETISSGEFLGVVLGVGLGFWLLADLGAWLLGMQTFSQWVIKEAKKRMTFAVGALLVILAIAGVLVWHFELVDIIKEHLGW